MTVRPEAPAPGGEELISAWALRGPAGAPTCCLVPTSAGARLFRQQGERGFRSAVSAWLLRRGISAPPRLLAALPPEGELPGPRPTSPTLRVVERHPGGIDARFEVPFDLAIFDGHFPWVPIVPGAMLVGWSAGLAAREGLWPHGAMRISSVKFRHIVQPGPEYQLRLTLGAGGDRLDLRIESPRGVHATGTLLAPAP